MFESWVVCVVMFASGERVISGWQAWVQSKGRSAEKVFHGLVGEHSLTTTKPDAAWRVLLEQADGESLGEWSLEHQSTGAC